MGPPLHCLPCRWWEGGLDRWASGLIQASAAFSACVRAAVDESPGASLILGGFSQADPTRSRLIPPDPRLPDPTRSHPILPDPT